MQGNRVCDLELSRCTVFKALDTMPSSATKRSHEVNHLLFQRSLV